MPAPQARKAEQSLQTMPQSKSPLEQNSRELLGGSDSDDPTEKDETEIELEKLLFGDNTGFHEGLKTRGRAAGALVQHGNEQSQREVQDGIADEGLEGVDDADVCIFHDSTLTSTCRLILCSAVFP